MATRRFISKEVAILPTQYVGQFGEVWIGDDDTVLRVGNNITPGGVMIAGSGGTPGPSTLCPPGVNTVVYSASTSSIQTIKIIVQAMGFETGITDFMDTHSADVMAVKNLRTGLGEASVYGVTYTSANPLITFDAQVTDNVLQIIAQPTSLVNNVTVNTLAIEIEG